MNTSNGCRLSLTFQLDISEGSPSDFEQHSCIQKLGSVLDLRHTCGFLTLLRTGQTNSAPTTARSTAATPAAAVMHSRINAIRSPSVAKFSKDSANAAAVSTGGTENSSSANSPSNGIRDSMSAEMLASELDCLEEKLRVQQGGGNTNNDKTHTETKERHADIGNPGTSDRSKLTLELQGSATHAESGSGKHTAGSLVGGEDNAHWENQWVLLDCSFGIPLFDATVNKQVCERVASHSLCCRDR